jgi:hypothetical protein
MTEAFLQFIWKYRMFEEPLRLNDGNILEIMRRGAHNSDSGQDFLNLPRP